jgi:hypothetical protein
MIFERLEVYYDKVLRDNVIQEVILDEVEQLVLVWILEVFKTVV